MGAWEPAAGSMSQMLMPGEMPSNGATTLGGNGWKSPVVIPADFYYNPENYGFRQDADFPTHAVELRGSLALYDYRKVDDAFEVLSSYDDLAQSIVFISPKNWRSVYISYVSVAPPPPEPFGPYFSSMNLMGVGH